MNDPRSNPHRDTGGFSAAAHVSAPALAGPFVPNAPLFLASLPFIDGVTDYVCRRHDGVPVAGIARTLHLNQKRLYRTLERLCADLRTALETGWIRHGRRARAICRRSRDDESVDAADVETPAAFSRAGIPWLQKR